MEQTDLSAQIEYLDQRYQEDQERIAKLQQRIETQEYELQEQARRIEILETELAEAQVKFSRTPQFDEQLNRLRKELLQTIEQQYSRRQESFIKEASNTLTVQLDGQSKTLYEFRRELDKTRRYEEQISLARLEVERLNREVTTFQTHLDEISKHAGEPMRALDYLEEQRRNDARRLVELQNELPGLHKKIESSLTKVQLVEQQIPQFGQYQLALDEIREDIRRHREHMDFQIAERERQIKNWIEIVETQEQRRDKHEGLMEKYAEHYQLNKRALESLQDFQERIQREHHHALELQRLAEERQRAEIEKWQTDYEQQWKKQRVEWKPPFADLQRTLELLQKQINEVAKFNQTIEKQVDMVLQIMEEDVQARTMTSREWQHRFEELANGRT